MNNFLQHQLNENLEGCTIIPIDRYCPITHKIFMGDIAAMEFIQDNEVFNECYEILVNALKFIISKKKENHAFTEPNLIYRPNINQIGIEIGVMAMDQYNKMMGINNND